MNILLGFGKTSLIATVRDKCLIQGHGRWSGKRRKLLTLSLRPEENSRILRISRSLQWRSIGYKALSGGSSSLHKIVVSPVVYKRLHVHARDF